jgi:4-hydroxybenzoate polyprenyltransferase
MEVRATRTAAARKAHAAQDLRLLLEAARPLQWTKNLLLFAGVIFSKQYGDAGSWAAAATAFVAFCAASSAAYLWNDIVDRERDRSHPAKRLRPIASGTITPRRAFVAGLGLAIVALALAAPLGPESVALVAGFLALQAAYSLALKHLVLVDVLVIAILFVLRAAAGAAAVDVWLSPWLVLCSGLLALFLALAKRRAELAVTPASNTSRPVLGSYSLVLVDQLIAVVAAATISAYSLYTFTASESSALMLTIPLVVFGLFRYLQLVHGSGNGSEEPERLLVTDWPLLATIMLWAATAIVILAID